MAKRKKAKGKKARAVVKAVARKARAAVAETRRTYRAARSINVTKKDVILSVAGAGAGAIGSALVLSKLPESIPGVAKNAIVAGLGGFLSYKGVKKRNMILTGLGLGMAAVGARGLITVAVPSLAAPFVLTPSLAAPFVRTPAALAAPILKKPVPVVRTIKDEEYV